MVVFHRIGWNAGAGERRDGVHALRVPDIFAAAGAAATGRL